MSEVKRGNSDETVEHPVRKIRTKAIGGRAKIIKVRYLVALLALLAGGIAPQKIVQAGGCPDVRVVFARGSGGERWNDQNYLAFKTAIESKLSTTSLSYDFVDLDYPAVGVGLENIGTSVGAYVGSGDAYEFGDSVNTGVENLIKTVNSDSCSHTRYVIGGYSQGAMVISKSLGSLNSNKLIYAATFGDPKIYLPEGAGIMPAACSGSNLSDYRMYVPDCQAYKGLLGAYIPYEPAALVGKVGTWCNKRDVFCSSHLSIGDHVAYVADQLYEDASKVIFYKITEAFGLENHISSLHDTAILIDSTGSMSDMIEKYKAEALRLAKETLDSGGRVALYDYRDLDDPYTPVKHCDFDTCTLETFRAGLDNIHADNGGDTPESLLSGSLHVMKDLKWKYGSTKSLVVLTDADFLAPDRDGVTFDEVVAVSKKIDPVNFYIITNDTYANSYIELATATDGKVVTNLDELNLLTDYIMERYDSLPRVEEGAPIDKPTLEIISTEYPSYTEAAITFTTTGTRTMVVLNDTILGVTEDTSITISNLDRSVENTISLIPLGDDIRGETATVNIPVKVKTVEFGYGEASSANHAIAMPKAPNSGKQ